MTWAELEGRIVVEPVPVTPGEELRIRYNGLLAESGAESVYLHYGYGTAKSWHDISSIPMQKMHEGFETRFRVENHEGLHFCFKDCAENWDNNHGRNWTYTIHDGR
jgi:hypothetical protein